MGMGSPPPGWGMGQMPQAQNHGTGYQPGNYMGAGMPSMSGGFGGSQGPGYQGGQSQSSYQGGQDQSGYQGANQGLSAAPQIANGVSAQGAGGATGLSARQAITPNSSVYATQPINTAPATVAAASTNQTPNSQNPNWAGFYLPSGAPSYLVNNQLPGNSVALNSSLNSGNGHISDADIPYLDAAAQNQASPYYSEFKQLGLDPTMAGNMLQTGGYNPSDPSQIGAYLAAQSLHDPVAGATYSYSPQGGLYGSMGNVNFNVMPSIMNGGYTQGGMVGTSGMNIGQYGVSGFSAGPPPPTPALMNPYPNSQYAVQPTAMGQNQNAYYGRY